MKRIRQFLFGTKFRIAISLLSISICGLIFFLPIPGDKLLLLGGGIQGHPEYCEHSITPQKRVRLGVTPYAFPQRNGGKTVDPNNWRNEPFAHDFLAFNTIVVPYVDYEISNDGGKTWDRFWRYENQVNEYAWCNAFDTLDESNFWMWTRNSIAITHDAGASWILGDDYKKWAKNRNVIIDYIKFDTPEIGQLVFVYEATRPDPTLLTQDGGKTWHIDPSWNQ
jgi:hypothetical protein